MQAVTVGTPLAVMNNDAILHNVHGNEAGAGAPALTVFNLAMPIKGQKLPVPMRKPGLIRLQCDAGHTWMNAWIYVFDHPYFAVTDDRGAFVIDDVPRGRSRGRAVARARGRAGTGHANDREGQSRRRKTRAPGSDAAACDRAARSPIS